MFSLQKLVVKMFMIMIVSLICLNFINCSSYQDITIFKLNERTTDFDLMIKEIGSADIVYIGESHTVMEHHKIQLEIIKSLYKMGHQLAIGLEMFTNKDQAYLERWIDGKIDKNDFIKAFYSNWNFGWGYYKDIFYFARENKIPMIGLNIPKEITRKVGEKGFKSLDKTDLENLPPEISCEVDPKYMELLQELFKIKEHRRSDFINFCEAQILWDQSMAWHLNNFFIKNPKIKIVVLTGNLHAWKYGIPKQINRFNNTVKQIIILQGQNNDLKGFGKQEADYLIIHQPQKN